MINSPYPCGRCYECLSKLRSDWSIRLQEEFKSATAAYHAILTYSDDNLPRSDNGLAQVSKRDCQLFIKRLRHSFDNHISYFLAAEYGETSQRPHYHIVIFNVPKFGDVVHVGKYELSETMRGIIQSAWQLGYVRFRSSYIISHAQLHYLTKDIYNWTDPEELYKTLARIQELKKKGKKNVVSIEKSFLKNTWFAFENSNFEDDRAKTFRLMSKNLGLSYLNNVKFPPKELILKYDKFFVPTRQDGQVVRPPHGFTRCGELNVANELLDMLVLDGKILCFPEEVKPFLQPYILKKMVSKKRGDKLVTVEEIDKYSLPRYYRDRSLSYGFRGLLYLKSYFENTIKRFDYNLKYAVYDATHDIPYYILQNKQLWERYYKSHKDKYSQRVKSNFSDSQ